MGLIARERPDALLIVEDALTVGHTKQIADFASRERLATMLGNPALVGAAVSSATDRTCAK